MTSHRPFALAAALMAALSAGAAHADIPPPPPPTRLAGDGALAIVVGLVFLAAGLGLMLYRKRR